MKSGRSLIGESTCIVRTGRWGSSPSVLTIMKYTGVAQLVEHLYCTYRKIVRFEFRLQYDLKTKSASSSEVERHSYVMGQTY